MSNDSWCTPDYIYDPLFEEFGFQVDLCANKDNAKCSEWTDNLADYVYSKSHSKFDTFWINPPYSRGNIDYCMSIVELLNRFSKTVVSLTRFDPSAKWFKESVDGMASEVRMLDKRVKFKGASSGYNFPCCISVYRGFIPLKTNYYIWGCE